MTYAVGSTKKKNEIPFAIAIDNGICFNIKRFPYEFTSNFHYEIVISIEITLRIRIKSHIGLFEWNPLQPDSFDFIAHLMISCYDILYFHFNVLEMRPLCFFAFFSSHFGTE